jgi:hypothetical protein
LVVHLAVADANDANERDVDADTWKDRARLYVGVLDERWPGVSFRRVYETKR